MIHLLDNSLTLSLQAEDGIRDYKVTGVQTCFFLIQAEDGIRDYKVTGVQTCALPILAVQGTALPTLSVAAVVASGNDGNVPQNTLDNNLATRWSAYGDGQWIRYDLGALTAIDGVNIAWYLGSPVVNGPSRFDIQVSLDTITWTTVFSGQSSGLTTQFEPYAFPPASGRYVRIVGHGNSMNAWNSITEVVLYDPPDTATATETNVPVASVTVSPASVNILVGGKAYGSN